MPNRSPSPLLVAATRISRRTVPPGGDFTATPTATEPNVGASLGWSTWYPKPDLIQRWANGTATNSGFLLKQSSENVTNVLAFAPSTSSDASKVPYLQVIYGPWVGERPFYPLLTQPLNDRTQLSVNLATGNLGVRQEELGVAGIGQDLTLSHWYNNQLFSTPDQAYTSDTGYKWTLNAGRDVRLIPFADGSVAFNAPSGFATPSVKNSNGSFTSPPGSNAKLVQNGDGTSTLTFNRTGLKYQFSSAGRLTAAVDQNGNTLRYGYNGSGAVTRITDTLGVAVTVGYNAANVRTTLTDARGRRRQYTYDANAAGDGGRMAAGCAPPAIGRASLRLQSARSVWDILTGGIASSVDSAGYERRTATGAGWDARLSPTDAGRRRRG